MSDSSRRRCPDQRRADAANLRWTTVPSKIRAELDPKRSRMLLAHQKVYDRILTGSAAAAIVLEDDAILNPRLRRWRRLQRAKSDKATSRSSNDVGKCSRRGEETEICRKVAG